MTFSARSSSVGGEVLIRVLASGVNPVDVSVRSGVYPILGEPGFGVGRDVSGVVEEASPGARFKVGDERESLQARVQRGSRWIPPYGQDGLTTGRRWAGGGAAPGPSLRESPLP
ncbi:alcohol dehydrogenase catalytic domain-containing protein [Streptosporangium sp. NPDC001559]|uniref:alcohol dehydrogenase catalytic domain-containing protein n=1 Tax=Streptosporangium sp. NPDC001559 TaxID=3366187 RepID=UPI0036E12D2E